MNENICKWSDWQGINLQNIETAHADQYFKKPNQKMGGRPKYTFLQRRYTDAQKIH